MQTCPAPPFHNLGHVAPHIPIPCWDHRNEQIVHSKKMVHGIKIYKRKLFWSKLCWVESVDNNQEDAYKRIVTFPMHFSKCGANLPATTDRPQFMQSNTSLATEGCVCPNMSTTYLLFVSALLLGSATLARACADNLNSSSSSSKLRSMPSLAIRWHSEATSAIMESRRSLNTLAESCAYNPQ